MNSYADRLAAEMAPLLPDDVEVTNAQGLIVIERGTARAMYRPTAGDRRRAVTLSDARDALTVAARYLAGEIPKYRESFQAPARELVEILTNAGGMYAPTSPPAPPVTMDQRVVVVDRHHYLSGEEGTVIRPEPDGLDRVRVNFPDPKAPELPETWHAVERSALRPVPVKGERREWSADHIDAGHRFDVGDRFQGGPYAGQFILYHVGRYGVGVGEVGEVAKFSHVVGPDEDEATTGATPAVVEPPRVPSKAAAAERLAERVDTLLATLDPQQRGYDSVVAALALYRGAPE